jgi:MFS family permease
MLTDTFVKANLVVALLATVLVEYGSHKVGFSACSLGDNEDVRSFHLQYLSVFMFAMMGDWLQGPYVYALYESYGFSRDDNAILFVCGFGASAIFGTFVGSWADKGGRKKYAGLYCVLYIISCMTKHFNNFFVLIVGRITGGVATSLLFSVFDAWLASEHNRRFGDAGANAPALGNSFSLAWSANSVVAILSGEVGQWSSDLLGKTQVAGPFHVGGYTMPFDVSILVLLIAGALLTRWPENYGESTKREEQIGLQTAMEAVLSKSQLLALGGVCAFFESSMYIFVFNWTPLVQDPDPNAPKPPFGHIFAAFMVMSMLGSRIFALVSRFVSVPVVAFGTLVIATCCHATVLLGGSPKLNFYAFLLFELCVGMYFPSIGTLKGKLVPEECRSAVYNLYRLPLNAIVVCALVFQISTAGSFFVTTFLLVVACILQQHVISKESARDLPYTQVNDKNEDEASPEEFAVGKLDSPKAIVSGDTELESVGGGV